MSNELKARKTVVSPKGKLQWAKDLVEPNEKGKFSACVRIPKGEAADAWAEEQRARHKAVRGNLVNCPVKDGDAKDGPEWASPPSEYDENSWLVRAKTGYQVKLYDSKKNDITKTGLKPSNGDEVRIAYSENISNVSGNKGVFLYLDAVQIIKHYERDAGNAFDEEEDGFVADTPANDNEPQVNTDVDFDAF